MSSAKTSPETSAIAPLSEPRFLETHVSFETSSDQQDQIRDALAAAPLSERASVLSLGPGSGILDGPLLERLAPGRRLRYVGVEPNRLQSRELAERLAALALDVEIHTSTFEGYDADEAFDAVWVIHTHYYFSDVPHGLGRALELVAPGGRLVVAAAPRGALNQLSQRFWSDHAPDDLWFSTEVQAFFRDRAIPFSLRPIEGRLDVSACFDGLPVGDAIRDFVVQAEVSAHPAARARVDEELRAMGRQEPDGRWTVPHPVDLLEVVRPG